MKQEKYILMSKDRTKALYTLKDLKARRYRNDYPYKETPLNKGMTLKIVSSYSRALEEQEALYNYCQEKYDIVNFKEIIGG